MYHRRPSLLVFASLILLLNACALVLTAPVEADEIPATLRPNWPELGYPADIPVWVAASQAFGADGKLIPTLFLPEARERVEFLLQRPKDPAKGCVAIAWIEQDYVDPPDRSTLARAVASSEMVVWGKVVAAEAGFERGDFGQMLMVEPIELLKPAGAVPARAYFVFVAAGRLRFAGVDICKEDQRAVLPAIGDEVLLLPRYAPNGENYLNLEYEGSLIAFENQGETKLPRILAAESRKPAGLAGKIEVLNLVRGFAKQEKP